MQKAKNYILIAAAALIAADAVAISAPIVTQPKPGVLEFSWVPPATRANGAPLAASEIAGYELYLTNEAAAISIPAASTSYTYTVPVGYTIKSTDVAQMIAVDTGGLKSQPSPAVSLPAGVSTPKPQPGAPTSLTVVRVPN